MKEHQVNWQVSFNPRNMSHRQVMDWIQEQTTNRSSFIRETLVMRMMGMFGFKSADSQEAEREIDADEVLRLIEV